MRSISPRCFSKCVFAFVVILLLMMLILFMALRFASSWLSVSDELVKADVMVILAGDPARAIFAAELFLQGYAKEIYISKPQRLPSLKKLDEIGVFYPRHEEIYKQVLMKKGVPESVIRFFGHASISTADEALALEEILPATSSSVLIVTSPYHVRRTRFIFEDTLPNIRIHVVPMPYEKLPANWWNDQNAARDVLLEVVKTLHYWLTGGFHSEGGSSKVPV